MEEGSRVGIKVMQCEKAIAGFEDGREPVTKECMKALEAGEGRETNSLLHPPERNTALLTPCF